MALKFGRLPRLLGAKPAAGDEAPPDPLRPAEPATDALGLNVATPDRPEADTPTRLGELAAGLAVVATCDVDLLPGGRFGLTSDDPWIAFAPVEPAPGCVLVELKLDVTRLGSDPAMYGKLYLDFGDGFDEQRTLELSADGRSSLSALIAGPGLLRRLRWDPDTRPGEVDIRRLSLTAVDSADALVARVRELAEDADRANAVSVAERLGPGLFAGGVQTPEQAFEATRRLTRTCLRASLVTGARDGTVDFTALSPAEVRDLHEEVAHLAVRPIISIVTPVYRTEPAILAEMIDSVRAQIYPDWELCLADDHSQDAALAAALDRYAAEDARIKVVHRTRNGHISAASNSALEVATGEWLALLDHDDVLTPDALLRVVQEIQADPGCEIIYSDEDKLDPLGGQADVFRKPDFSIELFRSQNYLNHLTVVRTASVRAVGGWRLGFEGSQDHDLLLRVLDRSGEARVRHIQRILYHWRMTAGSTAIAIDQKGYAYVAGTRALEEHLERRKFRGHIEKTPRLPYYRVRLDLPEPPPRVSLIIPTRDRADILEMCVRSILLKTDYPDFELMIVDNGSVEARTLALLEDLQGDERVRVVGLDAPFNFSTLNNFGVAQTDAPLIAMVNNDIEVISPDWLTEMVSWTIQPDVGCVGAKLYYPDDTIQHAGVIIGLGGVAGHSHKHFRRDDLGYFGRLILPQDLSAVTAACLLVRRSIFLEVGGLNETDLAVAFNDVDFCLRVREAGYRNVFTPFAELYHHESASRGAEDDPAKIARFNGEIAYMKKRWGRTLLSDPFYSPHLTLAREDFSPA